MKHAISVDIQEIIEGNFKHRNFYKKERVYELLEEKSFLIFNQTLQDF